MPREGPAGQAVAPGRPRTGCVRRGDPRQSSRGTRCQRRRARSVRRCPRLGRSLHVDARGTRRGLRGGGPGSAMVRLRRAGWWSDQARCWGWSWQFGLSFVGGDGRSGRCRTCRRSPLPRTPPGADTSRPPGSVVTAGGRGPRTVAEWYRCAVRRAGSGAGPVVEVRDAVVHRAQVLAVVHGRPDRCPRRRGPTAPATPTGSTTTTSPTAGCAAPRAGWARPVRKNLIRLDEGRPRPPPRRTRATAPAPRPG